MDRIDTLELKGIDKGSTLAYDPWTQTHIVGGHGVLFSSQGETKRFLPDPKLMVPPEDGKKIQLACKGKERCPPESLRFVPNQKSQLLLISPSGTPGSRFLVGLMVLSRQSGKSSECPIVYTNYGFSSGVHYWEIICPLSCTGLSKIWSYL